MRKIFSPILLFVVTMTVSAQQTYGPQLPNLVPTSPDATAITKGADLSSSLFTGAAQASIPLYEMKCGGFFVPVALSYGSSGLRVDELPSKVGMGWSLSCSGVVTRTMHDRPDEKGTTPPPLGTSPTPQQTRDYYYSLTTDPDYDTEPDEFFVSAPGLKAKFILDDNDNAILIPFSKIKVDVTISSSTHEIDRITVVNTNGIKYEFGTSEEGVGHAYDKTLTPKEDIRTAFYIKRITLTDGRTIDFSYVFSMVVYYAGVSQSLVRGSEQNLSLTCGCNLSAGCLSEYADASNMTKTYDYTEQSMSFLASITSSDGQLVNFEYEVFDEESGDSRIKTITAQAGAVSRKWKLHYIKPTTINTGFSAGTQGLYADYNPRFFLSRVDIVATADPEFIVGKYGLEYHEVELLPKRLSYAQDYLGYFNGANNSTFLPAIPGEEIYWGALADADRNFHGAYASRGLLEKVIFPTGGSETFFYEPNTTATFDPIGNSWVNYEAGGVRVQKITAYDQLSNTSTTRYFTYATKDALDKSSGNAVAPEPIDQQGIEVKNCPNSGGGTGDCGNQVAGNVCQRKTLNSSSLTSLYGNDGARVMYSAVIEHNDPSFLQGGIEHKFDADVRTNVIDAGPNFPIKSIPANTISSPQGMETETNYFDAEFNTVKKVVYDYDEFNDPALIQHYNARALRLTYNSVGSTLLSSNPMAEFDIMEYQHKGNWVRLAGQETYTYQGLNAITNTQTITYDDNGPHTMPVKTETTDSKGNTLVSETKYPTDFLTAPYTYMVTKNILEAPVEVIQKENSVQLSKTSTVYKDWFNDQTIITPELVKFKLGTFPEEEKIKFYEYDDKENVKRMAKDGDINICYLWDYNKRYLVAEAKNASKIAYTSFEANDNGNWAGIPAAPTDRVETSVTAATDLSVSVTGKYYFQGINFSFSVTGESDKPYYYVTYWTGNSSAYTVTSSVSGWPKLLRTLSINGKTWKLYEHKVPGNTAITISGTGDIDELRFFPEGAQMVTYTYSPFAGISSQADINNKITYYAYDELGRLSHVRDEHKNILRKICYNFAGEVENCGMQLFYNVEKSGVYTKNNCPCGSTGLPFTYTVPAGTYVSSVSQAIANTQAQADVDANGQAQANAASAATYCSAPAIYARMEYVNMYTIAPSTYATPTIKFYCDAACTTPVYVTNLAVSWFQDQIYCDENRPEIHTNPTHTITGYSYTISTNIAIVSGGVNQSCFTRSYSMDTGTGYTAIY